MKKKAAADVLTAEHKIASLAELYSLPILASHRLAFDDQISSDNWSEMEVVSSNSAAAMNFGSQSGASLTGQMSLSLS